MELRRAAPGTDERVVSFSPLTFGEVGGATCSEPARPLTATFQSPNVRGSRWSIVTNTSGLLTFVFQSPNVRGSRWSRVARSTRRGGGCQFQSPNVRGSRWSCLFYALSGADTTIFMLRAARGQQLPVYFSRGARKLSSDRHDYPSCEAFSTVRICRTLSGS